MTDISAPICTPCVSIERRSASNAAAESPASSSSASGSIPSLSSSSSAIRSCLSSQADAPAKPVAAGHFLLQLAGDALALPLLLADSKLLPAIAQDGIYLRVTFEALCQ